MHAWCPRASGSRQTISSAGRCNNSLSQSSLVFCAIGFRSGRSSHRAWDCTPLLTLSFFSKWPAYLIPIMLTSILVNNCGYIIVSFQVVDRSLFWARIQHTGHGFIDFLTYAAFGVLTYSKNLCLVILSLLLLLFIYYYHYYVDYEIWAAS